jgi:ribonuclease HI
MQDKIIIFSDGSSRGNPGPGGWGAIIKMPDGIIKEIGGSDKHTTNNRMELLAGINAIKSLRNPKEEIVLYTDSSYLINGITKWIYGWQKNNWINTKKEEVMNRDLWEELIRVSSNKRIRWTYVGGHAGTPGNERCDIIATSFADLNLPELFEGHISKYKFDLSNIKGDGVKKTSKTKSKAPAYSYLSKIGGLVKIYKTWSECERDVKGVKNAKYKKAISKEHERKIIKEWK